MSAASVEVDQLDRFDDLRVVCPLDLADLLGLRLTDSGAGVLVDEIVRLDVAWLREQGRAHGSGDDWSAGFDGMLAYAARTGWMHGEQAVSAHVEKVEVA